MISENEKKTTIINEKKNHFFNLFFLNGPNMKDFTIMECSIFDFRICLLHSQSVVWYAGRDLLGMKLLELTWVRKERR